MHKKNQDYKVAIFTLVLFLLVVAAMGYLWYATAMDKDIVGAATEFSSDKTGSQDTFKFVVIADIPSSMNSINPPQHSTAAIASIHSLQSPQPELVIINGNMISGLPKGKDSNINNNNDQGIIKNKWDAFYQQIYKPLTIKGLMIAPVAGSLDILLENPSLLTSAYQSFWQQYKPSVKINGNYPFTYSFDYKNSHFAVLNTADNTITNDQITWFEEDLSSTKKENIFVFSHVPPESFCNDAACSSLQSTEKQILFQLMKKYNVKIFFTGNNHLYYKARYQGVNVVASGAIGGTFDIISTDQEKYKQNPSYVVVDVQGNDIRVGAITGNLGPSFNNGFTESLLPSMMPGYDQYTELTKNPVQIIPTVISQQTAQLRATISSSDPKMDQWDILIIDACKTEQNQKECFALVKAVMYVESHGNPNAVSSTGCKGLFQFCAGTAKSKTYREFFDENTIGKENDDRFNPEKSIRAGKKFLIDILKKQMQIDNVFIIYLGFNAGPSYSTKAKEYFQDRNPTQAEIEAWLEQLGLSDIKKKELKTAFPKLIKKYLEYLNQGISSVNYPSAYTPIYGASNLQKINAPSAISYYITPSFTLNQDQGEHSINVYGKLREYIRWYVQNTESCTNTGKSLESCSQDSIASLNKEPYFAANIGMFDDCTNQESGLETFFYDLVEEIKACLRTTQDKMCAIPLRLPPQPPAVDGEYSILFKQENEKIIIELRYNGQPLTSFSHTLQEQVDKRALLLSDIPNREGSKQRIDEFYITFELVNNQVAPMIYYKLQGEEELKAVTTTTLYLMPDSEQNIIILSPVIGNTQSIDADVIADAGLVAQTARKLCITSVDQQPYNYFETINYLQIRPLEYQFAVRFDNSIKSIENFLEPMPTFLDLKSTELTIEQLQLLLKNRKIAILGDTLAIKGEQKNGFITQLKKSLPATSFSIYAKDSAAQWLKDNYFTQQILSQTYDILIVAVGTKDVCDAIEFRNLITSVDTMVNQFKVSNQGSKVLVVGLPSTENEVCNENIFTYNAFINKNDQNNKQVTAQLEEQFGQKLSASNIITKGLDIYPETSLFSDRLKYRYHHTTINQRKTLPRKKASESEIHTAIYQRILDALRGLQENTNNLNCKSVFALGTSSTARADNKGGYIQRLREGFPTITFASKGYPTEDTGFITEKFETEILPTIKGNVDCLIVAAGLNDIGNLEQVKKNLKQIYDLAHKHNMNVIAIELQPYFQQAQNPNAYENTKSLNTWLATEADIEAVIKIYNIMNDPEHEGRIQIKYVSMVGGPPDFMHYNYDEGHKLVAEQIAKTIFGTTLDKEKQSPKIVSKTLGSKSSCIPEQDITHTIDESNGAHIFSIVSDNCLIEVASGNTITDGKKQVVPADFFAEKEQPALIINGGFFDIGNTGKPLGLTIENNQVTPSLEPTHYPQKDTSYFIIDNNNQPSITTINPTPMLSMIKFARETAALVKNHVPITEETCPFSKEFCKASRPRTGVCLTSANQVKFILVNSMSVMDFATYLASKEVGCKDALNFDGGGSTQAHYYEDKPLHLRVFEPKQGEKAWVSSKPFRQVSDVFIVKSYPVIVSSEKTEPLNTLEKEDKTTDVTFIVIGDQGSGGNKQKKTAAAIRERCKIAACDFIITVGDNIYGKTPDENIPKVFEKVLEKSYQDITNKITGKRVPIYLTLGNHDYSDGGKAWIDYVRKQAQEQEWLKFSPTSNNFVINKGQVLLLGLDGRSQGKNGVYGENQVQWAKQQIQSTKKTWIITFSHYPFMSIGKYRFKASKTSELGKIICGNVDLHIAGHDHNKQFFTHNECNQNRQLTSMIVGASGDWLYPINGKAENNLFAAKTPGYALVKIQNNDAYVVFYDNNNKLEQLVVLHKNEEGTTTVTKQIDHSISIEDITTEPEVVSMIEEDAQDYPSEEYAQT